MRTSLILVIALLVAVQASRLKHSYSKVGFIDHKLKKDSFSVKADNKLIVHALCHSHGKQIYFL
jgi:hypothetical protein